MMLVLVLAASLVIVMARFAYVAMHMAFVDGDYAGAALTTVAMLAIAAGGMLVLLNVGAWSQ